MTGIWPLLVSLKLKGDAESEELCASCSGAFVRNLAEAIVEQKRLNLLCGPGLPSVSDKTGTRFDKDGAA